MGVQAGIAEGGLVISDAIDNINRCIVEKTNKIQSQKDLHDEWWLVLVEHNVYATALQEPDELQAVKNKLIDTNTLVPHNHLELLGRHAKLRPDLIHSPTEIFASQKNPSRNVTAQTESLHLSPHLLFTFSPTSSLPPSSSARNLGCTRIAGKLDALNFLRYPFACVYLALSFHSSS